MSRSNNLNLNWEKDIRCKCGEVMTEDSFTDHFKKCANFKQIFRKFDQEFAGILKNYSEPKENLLIIRFLLKQYITVLTKKIKAHFIEINLSSDVKEIPPNRFSNPNQSHCEIKNVSSKWFEKDNNSERVNQNKSQREEIDSNINNINNNNNGEGCDYGRPFTWEASRKAHSKRNKKSNFSNSKLNQIDDNCENEGKEELCQVCQDINIWYLECCHCICTKCFTSAAEKDIPNMICKECQNEKRESFAISEKDKKGILGAKVYDDWYNQCNIALFGNIIECPKCNEKISFEEGLVDYNIKDDNNKVISKQSALDYAANRCRCPKCHIIFCLSCKAIPYHLGKTCSEFKWFQTSLKCRYDNTVITDLTKGPNEMVCNNKECLSRYKASCKKTLACGHRCYGCKKESQCPPCLDKECPSYVNYFSQDIDDYCNICFIEGLGNSPVVLLSCNHYIHFKCIETRWKKKWTGPKITFGHCLCPVCNKWLDCPTVPDIQEMIDKNKRLYDKMSKMALERLKFEGLDKDPKLTDKNSVWFNNHLAYALNRISYYMCYQCKEPYFAGLRECGEGPNVNPNDPNKEYDPKDCVCSKHANIFGVAGVTDCKTHGKDFIQYKCRFCCKVSSWFCWGTTHFCDDCHSRQCKGDYVSKYKKEMLPVCDSRTCQIKVKHPPNGEEFALGCSVCKVENSNLKNF